MNRLQKSLLLNFVFSAFSGLVLIFANKNIAQLFDTSNSTVFWIVGAALIYFSLTILFEVKRQKRIGVRLIIFQDILWVIGSCVLLIFQPFEISTSGNIVIAAVAGVVLFMALNQRKAMVAAFD